MDEALKTLIELQKIDTELSASQKILDDIPIQEKKINEELLAEEELVKAQQEKVTAHEKEQRSLEMNLKTTENGIEKLQTQLFSCKNNKEYETVKHEIQTSKDKISATEEKILIIMDALEEEQKTLAEEKRIYADKKTASKSRLDELKARQEQESAHKETLQNSRDPLLSSIKENVRIQYAKIAKFRRNLAVSEINLHCCLGCNTALPPQFINEVMKNDSIRTCHSCGRILYWNEINNHMLEKGAQK